MKRTFYQWAGGDPQDHESLAWFSGAAPQQMGACVTQFRGGFAGSVWAKGACLGIVCGLGVFVFALLAAPAHGLVVGSVGLLLVLLLTAAILVAAALLARRYHHNVHQHGLVLTGPKGDVHAIPWATVDPGRIFIATSTRAMTRMPLALHRQRAFFAPGVVLNGWTDRPKGTHAAFEAFSSGYRHQPMPKDSPFGWWQLGVADPRELLAAIESAMVADGYPAAGLTSFALSRRFAAGDLRRNPALQEERALTDPPIGLP